MHKVWKLSWTELTITIAFVVVLLLILVPAVRNAKQASKRPTCAGNLKLLALGFELYQENYGCLPPAYTVDAEGNRLHSWRTLLLPYLEQQSLYAKIDLNKPWNDPANLAAVGDAIPKFMCARGVLYSSEPTGWL